MSNSLKTDDVIGLQLSTESGKSNDKIFPSVLSMTLDTTSEDLDQPPLQEIGLGDNQEHGSSIFSELNNGIDGISDSAFRSSRDSKGEEAAGLDIYHDSEITPHVTVPDSLLNGFLQSEVDEFAERSPVKIIQKRRLEEHEMAQNQSIPRPQSSPEVGSKGQGGLLRSLSDSLLSRFVTRAKSRRNVKDTDNNVATIYEGEKGGDGFNDNVINEDLLNLKKDNYQSNDSDGMPSEGEYYGLDEDVFSLMFVAPIRSGSFLYACFILFIQLTILILAMVNLLKDAPPGNQLNVPPFVTGEVAFAQFLALIVSILTNRDIVTGLGHDQFNDEVLATFTDASYRKWVLSHVLRFIEGFLGIVVAFLFIVQSTDVLDLFLNFAVIQFVSELDDVGFYLASKGFVPSKSIQHMASDIKLLNLDYNRVKLPDDALKRKKMVQQSIFIVSLLFLFGGWSSTKAFQNFGTYYNSECQMYGITFPSDLQYDFFEQMCSDENIDCPKSWELRKEPIHYSSFSDTYMLHDIYDRRPTYTQRGEIGEDAFGVDSPAGIIKYCREEMSWVFTIPGVTKSGGSNGGCNWLLKSPRTSAFTLDDVPESDWMVWTGIIHKSSVDIKCLECNHKKSGSKDDQGLALGCNYHGSCTRENTCDCNFPFMGAQCDVCAACQILDLINYEDDVAGEYLNDILEGGKMIRLDVIPYQQPLEIYNRPVYYHGQNFGSEQWLTAQDLVVTLYLGSAWAVWNITSYVDVVADGKVEMIEFFQSFHSTWDFTQEDALPWYISTPTDSDSPRGLQWTDYETGESLHFDFGCNDNGESGIHICDFIY